MMRTEGTGMEAAPSSYETVASVVHETSPDSLKNNSTNIAKLEDVIEQCEGRRKYLAHTVSPSDGGDVRWYFREVSLRLNELAASLPHTEIVGKGDYFRFGVRDSLAIEAFFLQNEEELLSCWWREYAECYGAPKGRLAPIQPGIHATEVYLQEEERVGVPVKGGLYEVDLAKRQCFPVYWSGDNRRILRGHWFAFDGGLDWLPLREDVSEQLEHAYRCQVWRRRSFQSSGLYAARVEIQSSTPGLHALFTGEDDTWEVWLSVDAFVFSGVFLRGSPMKLRRGYSASQSIKPSQEELRQRKEEEMDDYCSKVPVKHLVFMVHGIGQRLEKSNLIDDVGTFRLITTRLAERHLTCYQRGTQRVLFIPCQWRRGLRLSGETAVEKITLDGVRGLRVMLSATVHDVLYYMSPIYSQEIIDSVTDQLNLLYLKFLRRNPGYDGRVSIYAHSLGSVLSYDILCHQENLSSPFPMEWMYKDSKDETSRSLPSEQLKDGGACLSTGERSCPDLTDNFNVYAGKAVLLEKMSENASVGLECSEAFPLEASEHIDNTRDKNVSAAIELKGLYQRIESLKARVAELELKCSSKHEREAEKVAGDMSVKIFGSMHPPALNCPISYTPYIKHKKLEFEVDTFFAVGSPLGVFLALRNVRIGIGKGNEYWKEKINEEMPACRKMFNIFHPFDPVAYRIEPLICQEYVEKRPVFIPYHKGGKRLHIGIKDFAERIAAHSDAVFTHLRTVREKILTVCQSAEADNAEGDGISDAKEEIPYGFAMIKRLTGQQDGRIDYMLQDNTFQHAYISAIGSHTNYWRDYDTALFILKHLYQDIPAEPPQPEGCFTGEASTSTPLLTSFTG